MSPVLFVSVFRAIAQQQNWDQVVVGQPVNGPVLVSQAILLIRVGIEVFETPR